MKARLIRAFWYTVEKPLRPEWAYNVLVALAGVVGATWIILKNAA